MRNNGTISDEIIIAQYNRKGGGCFDAGNGIIGMPLYSKKGMMSDEELTEIASRVASQYNIPHCEASFSAFNDFKVRWQRSYNWIVFYVSDYLQDAPAYVLEDLFRSLFDRILGNNDDYSPEVKRYVSDPSFARNHSKTYMERHKLKDTTVGEYHDLNDSINRLRDSGLLPFDMEGILAWKDDGPRVSGVSVLTRVVTVSKKLDQPGVPEYVLDYAVYHGFCHLIIGFDPSGEKHADQFEPLVSRYKMRREAENWIFEHGMYV